MLMNLLYGVVSMSSSKFTTNINRITVSKLQVPFNEITLSNGEKILTSCVSGDLNNFPNQPRHEERYKDAYTDGDVKKVRKTQLDYAKEGILTEQMEYVAIRESTGVDDVNKMAFTPDDILNTIAQGRAVIPSNVNHPETEPMIIGSKYAVKVNANIGASQLSSNYTEELEKLKFSLMYGADTVMDLSVGIEGIPLLRNAILRASPVPLGTVPAYEALDRAGGNIKNLTWELFLDTVIAQARQGVDYFTIHAGLLQQYLPYAAKRILGIVSRGGSIMAECMLNQDRENMAYEHFDELLEVCHDYDVALSLGDGLRPGCINDACDEAQYGELKTIGALSARCYKAGVQCFIEGPGHVSMDKIEENQRLEEKYCNYAPFYTLGPLVTDIAPGYDHITSAIGGANIAAFGTAMLCYVTPSEHLALPEKDDVKTGLITYKLAAHAADLSKGLYGAKLRDDAMARARAEFRWFDQFALSLDPQHAYEVWSAKMPEKCSHDAAFCSMCGPRFCPIRLNRTLKNKYL